MISTRLPNFFIIGAAKCGTTSLYDMLNQHPDVFMPVNKEPNFFCNRSNYSNDVEWFVEEYYKNAIGHKARGEASTHYLYWSDITSQNMLQTYKPDEIKLIAMFRDPVKRAYSHYWMMVRRNWENLSFEDAIKAENDRLKNNHAKFMETGSQQYGYFQGGKYATLLKPFLDQFPRENLHCILLKDLNDDLDRVMEGVSVFLGIKGGFKFKLSERNSAFIPRNQSIDQFLRRPEGKIFQLVKLILKRTPQDFQIKLKKRVISLNQKPTSNPPMGKGIERFLRDSYSSEITLLEKILSKDLSPWRVNSD